MIEKIARGIVRRRVWILAFLLIAAGFCVPGIARTRINYDLVRYLKEDTMTKRALRVMETEFGSGEQLYMMFENQPDDALADILAQLNALPQVYLAAFDPAEDVRTENGVKYQRVTLTLKDCDASALARGLRQMFPDKEPYAVGGSAAGLLDVQQSVSDEIPWVMAGAVAVVLIVLFLTSHAWLEPLVILPVLALSILINMGTNFIFPDISFITFAVTAILQLALSIDYAIMLLNAYNAALETGLNREEAMEKALVQSFMPVVSSALTTVAGMMSLLFMSITIGFDIGLVLSKGILISMVCVFLLMPAVTLLFGGALHRTRHKPLRLGGEGLARGVFRLRRPLAAVLIAAVVAGFILQSGNTYLFTDSGQTAQRGESYEVSRVFGETDPMVILVPGGTEDADYERQRTLADKLLSLQVNGEKIIGDVAAMVTTGAEALKYYTPEDVASLTGVNALAVRLFFLSQGLGESVRADRLLQAADGLIKDNETLSSLRAALDAAQSAFNGPHYARMLLEMNLPAHSSAMRQAIDAIRDAAREVYGEDYYLTGVPMSTYDISSAFEGDLMTVNLITLCLIFLIVVLSFRAVILPALLVFVIEGAIWITMGISRVAGQPIFFMCYLICVCIQMGATIDYGILLSAHYRSARRSGTPVPRALEEALKKALPTVLTSGVILTTAGFIIGKLCTVYYISAIGLLLARGAAISVFLILTLLPALLALCDRFVVGKKKKA